MREIERERERERERETETERQRQRQRETEREREIIAFLFYIFLLYLFFGLTHQCFLLQLTTFHFKANSPFFFLGVYKLETATFCLRPETKNPRQKSYAYPLNTTHYKKKKERER